MDLSLILNPEQPAPGSLGRHGALHSAADFPSPSPSPSLSQGPDPPELVQVEDTAPKPSAANQNRQLPAPVVISTPTTAPALTLGVGSQQGNQTSQQAPLVAEAFPKRSTRNKAKEINYRELAYGPSLRVQRATLTASSHKKTRAPGPNSTPASGGNSLPVSTSAEPEGLERLREVSATAASESATINDQTGSKPPVPMAEPKDRSSSLTPPPEDLEDLLPDITGDFNNVPSVSLRTKQYPSEASSPKLKPKAQNAAADTDTPMVNDLNAMGVNGAPQSSPSKKRGRGKVVSYALPPPVGSGEDTQQKEEKLTFPMKNQRKENELARTKQKKKPGPKKGWKKAREVATATTARTPSSKTGAEGGGEGSEPRLVLSSYLVSSSTGSTPSPEESPSTEMPQNTAVYDSGLEDSANNSPANDNTGNASAPSYPPTLSSSHSERLFVPDPITIPDKYAPHRPMTNNQAIKLFDVMCERMDWHDKGLYESVGMQNMFGNRRAAAERFYRRECRKILMEGLAEAEGRMVGAPSNHPPMEVGVWPSTTQVSAGVEMEEE